MKLEPIKYDYEGIAKVLHEFKGLYEVCDNKDLLDECLREFCFPKMIGSALDKEVDNYLN